MHVRDLLQLERALESDGMVDPAPDKQEVPESRVAPREICDLCLTSQHGTQSFRKFAQRL